MSQRGTIPDWWRVFALNYIQTGNACQSYLKAKPTLTLGSAGTMSAKLLKDTRFNSFLEAMREPVVAAVELTRDSWLSELVTTFKLPVTKINGGEKARLGDMLGRAHGWIRDEGPTLTNFNLNVMTQIRGEAPQAPKELPSLKELEDLSQADVEEG